MAREFRFPVDIGWECGRRTAAHVEGKQPLQIATPPEFRGSDPELWSPEDAFVAAAGSCLAATIAAQPPLAVQGAKRAVEAAGRVSVADGLVVEAEAQAVCLRSDDMREAIEAFEQPPLEA